jgi:hypothetical protein
VRSCFESLDSHIPRCIRHQNYGLVTHQNLKSAGKDSIENSTQVEFKANIPLKFMSNSQLFVISAKSFIIGNFLFREKAASL